PIDVFLGSRGLGWVLPNEDLISGSVPDHLLSAPGTQKRRLQPQGVPKTPDADFTVAGPTGYIHSPTILPSTATGNFELTFAGAGFNSATEVRFGSTSLRASQVSGDGTRMTVQVSSSLLQTPGVIPVADPNSATCTVPGFFVRGIGQLS